MAENECRNEQSKGGREGEKLINREEKRKWEWDQRRREEYTEDGNTAKRESEEAEKRHERKKRKKKNIIKRDNKVK